MAGIQIDGTNQKLILDSDGDTYLEAATDDTIKVYIAGAHDATISANAINVLSGTTLTIDSGATITNSGTANGFSSADPSSADGDSLGTASAEWSDLFLADGGTIQFGNDQDVTLTHVADTALLLNSAMRLQFRDSGLYIGSNADGDLDIVSDGTAVDSINLESAGGITLDAGTAASGVIFEDDGTEMLRIYNSSSDVIIESKVSDKDIIIKGNDGGSTVTVATFDMSNAGQLILPGGINFPDTQVTSADVNTLDDYEEGEVTNGLDINGTTQTSYSSGRGNIQYVKVGTLVHLQCYLDTYQQTLATTGTLHMRLPFAVSNGSGTAFVTGSNFFAFSIAGTDSPVVSYLNQGDTTISGSHIQSEGDNNNCTIQSAAAAGATSDRIIMRMAMSYQTD